MRSDRETRRDVNVKIAGRREKKSASSGDIVVVRPGVFGVGGVERGRGGL